MADELQTIKVRVSENASSGAVINLTEVEGSGNSSKEAQENFDHAMKALAKIKKRK